jgi:hypothetical protein
MSALAWALLFALLGYGAGLIHFASLAHGVRRLVEGGRSWQAPALLLLRFAVSAAVMVAAARSGTLPLIAALGGWLLARTLRLRAVRRADIQAGGTPG